MSGNRNKLIAFNYFGGKFTWLEYLYTNFPRDFTHLVDTVQHIGIGLGICQLIEVVMGVLE